MTGLGQFGLISDMDRYGTVCSGARLHTHLPSPRHLDSSPSFHSLSLFFASGRPFLRFQSAAALYDFRSYSSSLSTMMRSPISFFLVAFLALMAGKGSWPLLPRA